MLCKFSNRFLDVISEILDRKRNTASPQATLQVMLVTQTLAPKETGSELDQSL